MRHALKGHRPGVTVRVGHRFAETHPIDGGAAFTEAEREELTRRGYELIELGDAPEEVALEDDGLEVDGAGNPSKAADRVAAQRGEAEQNAGEAAKAPRKSRKKS